MRTLCTTFVTVKFVVVTGDSDAAHKMADMHRSDTSILPKGHSTALDMCILSRADVITSVGTFSWRGYNTVVFCDVLYPNKDFWVNNWVGTCNNQTTIGIFCDVLYPNKDFWVSSGNNQTTSDEHAGNVRLGSVTCCIKKCTAHTCVLRVNQPAMPPA